MFKTISFTAFFLCSMAFYAQNMDANKLKAIYNNVSDSLVYKGNSFQFVINNRPFISIVDENANRMRIITPITEVKQLKEEELLNAMVANFHSALDVKYAISDNIIWAVFIHPLKELQEHQVIDAIKQVYTAAITFGDTYSSTNFIFPGSTPIPNKLVAPAKTLKKI